MPRNIKIRNILLGTTQIALAALFVFAGGFKLVASPEALAQGPVVLPAGFLRFIGLAELLGGIGLVGPSLVRAQRWVAPLAAWALAVIMAGATILSALAMGAAAALFPLVVGLLTVAVAIGRGPDLAIRNSVRRASAASVSL